MSPGMAPPMSTPTWSMYNGLPAIEHPDVTRMQSWQERAEVEAELPRPLLRPAALPEGCCSTASSCCTRDDMTEVLIPRAEADYSDLDSPTNSPTYRARLHDWDYGFYQDSAPHIVHLRPRAVPQPDNPCTPRAVPESQVPPAPYKGDLDQRSDISSTASNELSGNEEETDFESRWHWPGHKHRYVPSKTQSQSSAESKDLNMVVEEMAGLTQDHGNSGVNYANPGFVGCNAGFCWSNPAGVARPAPIFS